MSDGVDLGVPLELELLAELLADGGLDGFEDVGEHTEAGGVVGVVLAGALEHTGADKAGVPAVHVTANDVGRGVVTDHVDVLGEGVDIVDLLHPRTEDLVGVSVGGSLGLAVDDTLEIDASERLVHGLDTDAERTLRQTSGSLVVGGEDKITLREVDGDARGDGVLGAGQELAVLGEKKINDELHVGGVVAGVGEDEDGVELDLGEVTGPGLSALLGRERPPGRNGRIPGENVLGVNDVLETVVLGGLADHVTLTTEDEDSLVVFGQRLHGSVGLDELVGRDGVLEDLAELLATSGLGLTTTVGQ